MTQLCLNGLMSSKRIIGLQRALKPREHIFADDVIVSTLMAVSYNDIHYRLVITVITSRKEYGGACVHANTCVSRDKAAKNDDHVREFLDRK